MFRTLPSLRYSAVCLLLSRALNCISKAKNCFYQRANSAAPRPGPSYTIKSAWDVLYELRHSHFLRMPSFFPDATLRRLNEKHHKARQTNALMQSSPSTPRQMLARNCLMTIFLPIG